MAFEMESWIAVEVVQNVADLTRDGREEEIGGPASAGLMIGVKKNGAGTRRSGPKRIIVKQQSLAQ